MSKSASLFLCAIAVAAIAFAGCGSDDESDNRSDSAAGAPEQGFENSQTDAGTEVSDQEVAAARQNAQNPPTGNPKEGAPKEYRVGAELLANFPKGAVYNLEPRPAPSCVNDKRLGPYGPTTSDLDKSELWFFASQSFIDGCIASQSFQYWDFHLTKPFQGHQEIFLGQDSVGGSYHTDCSDWVKNSLTCETPGQLSIKISPES